MIISVPPAHPQNNGDNPGSTAGRKAPTKLNDMITTKNKPKISSIFAMVLQNQL